MNSYPAVAASKWFPRQSRTGSTVSIDLVAGVNVAWQRLPHEVLEVREVPHDLWPGQYADAWTRSGLVSEPQVWRYRPVVVALRRHGTTDRLVMMAQACYLWTVLPEHFWVCTACGELPPCGEEMVDMQMRVQAPRLRLVMGLSPGCCHGCGEVVQPRQKRVDFPGANLLRPDLGDNSVVFHARQSCRGAVEAYRRLIGDLL